MFGSIRSKMTFPAGDPELEIKLIILYLIETFRHFLESEELQLW